MKTWITLDGKVIELFEDPATEAMAKKLGFKEKGAATEKSAQDLEVKEKGAATEKSPKK